MLQPTSVIWDFNGTVMNDVELAAGAISELLRRRGLPTISVEDHRRVFTFPVSDYYRALGVDLGRERQVDVSDEFHELYLAGVADCSLNDGVRKVLDHFHAAGVPQFVLSAAEEAMVISWAEVLGVSDYFQAIYGLQDRLAATKEQRGEDLVRDHGLAVETTLFIGDTDHDVAVARRLGCFPVVVLKGHQPGYRIQDPDCTVLESFTDLLPLLTGRPGPTPPPTG